MSAAVGPHREMGKIGFRQLVHRYRNVSDDLQRKIWFNTAAKTRERFPFTADSINPTGPAESSFAKQTSFGTSNGDSNDFKEGLSAFYFPFHVVSPISALLPAGAYYQAI